MFGNSSNRIDLPSMPATLARIIQITNSNDATAEQLARVVMLDQSLSTKVLRLANSAFIGRRCKVETVTEAVVTLGFSSIRNLAASASVVDSLFPRQLFPGFGWQEMWVHSVTSAVAAETIYIRMPGASIGNRESAFLAGLLHDVGKLILARALPHKFTQIVEACREYSYDMQQAETSYLSTNHCKVGGDLAGQWEFPEALTEAIRYHHEPESAGEYDLLAKAVNAANLLAKRLSKSYIQGLSVEASIVEIAEASSLPPTEINDMLVLVRERVKECGEILAWGDKMPGARIARAA